MHYFIRAICIFTVLFVFTTAQAQTDVPRIISYQGQVTAADGKAINGTHHITVNFYSDRFGKTYLWQGQYDAEITNGIFNVILGSGKYKLPENSVMNRPLWIGVSVDGGAEMRPLSQMSGVPYAMNVPDKSITAAKLADDVLLSINNSSGHTPTVQAATGFHEITGDTNTTATMTVGSGAALRPAGTGTITANQFSGILPKANGGTGSSSGSWLLGGNALANDVGIDWFGSSSASTGSKEVWFKTNSVTALRLEPATLTGTVPNIIGGFYLGHPSDSNIIADINAPTQAVAVEGSVIAGGGQHLKVNAIGASFSFIGSGVFNMILHDFSSTNYAPPVMSSIVGGEGNRIFSAHGFIGGGYGNLIDIASDLNVVVGGYKNQAGDKNPSDTIDSHYVDSRVFVGGGDSNWAREELSVIVGGYHNKTESASTFIGGGENNIISHESEDLPASLSVIVGGKNDTINSQFGFIGGGRKNSIGKNSPDSAHHSNFSFIGGGEENKIYVLADHAAIIGGDTNSIKSPHAAIAGGEKNIIDTLARHSTIGGGHFNRVRSPLSSIVGGDSNVIHHQFSSYSFIGGGLQNGIDSGSAFDVVVGGMKNYNRGAWSIIGGGARNLIYDNSLGNIIGAGRDNYIGNINRSFNGKGILNSVICGGDTNTVAAGWSGILSGKWNTIGDKSEYAFLGSGKSNTIDTSSQYSAISAGLFNQIRSPLSVINGGDSNTIDLGITNSVIGGGFRNTSNSNAKYSTISGGDSNVIRGIAGVIGGGTLNLISKLDTLTFTSADWGTIGGGYNNKIIVPPTSDIIGCDHVDHPELAMPIYATISGGAFNVAAGHFSTVIGGFLDSALGMGSTVLGGWHLIARDWQTVCGRFNSLWGLNSGLLANDSVFNGNTVLPDTNSSIFIIGNGKDENHRSNAFTVSQDGHSSVFGVNQSGGATPPNIIQNPSYLGTTFSDNVLLAAGYIEPGAGAVPIVHSDFGVWNVSQNGAMFTITIHVNDPATNSFAVITNAWITATIVDTSTSASSGFPGMVTVSPMGASVGLPPNTFVVKTYNCSGCAYYPRRFMFHVFGRP